MLPFRDRLITAQTRMWLLLAGGVSFAASFLLYLTHHAQRPDPAFDPSPLKIAYVIERTIAKQFTSALPTPGATAAAPPVQAPKRKTGRGETKKQPATQLLTTPTTGPLPTGLPNDINSPIQKMYLSGTLVKLIPLAANTWWAQTEVTITEGDQVEIKAAGRIHTCLEMASGYSGCEEVYNDWIGPQGFVDRPYSPVDLMPNAPHAALIGRIGGSEVFYIGAHVEFKSPYSGPLYLGINDSYRKDNGDQFTLTVQKK
jgi:hypothetical protein